MYQNTLTLNNGVKIPQLGLEHGLLMTTKQQKL